MPINYKKAIIYKITCNNPDVKELYIGSTCNFKLRKANHKTTCNNPTHKYYNAFLYQCIRINGGFSNWTMCPIYQYLDCADKTDLRIKEEEYITSLGATLNKYNAYISEAESKQKNRTRIKNNYNNLTTEQRIARATHYKIKYKNLTVEQKATKRTRERIRYFKKKAEKLNSLE